MQKWIKNYKGHSFFENVDIANVWGEYINTDPLYNWFKPEESMLLTMSWEIVKFNFIFETKKISFVVNNFC